MPLTEKRKFQNRMSKRTFKHGNWRQVFIDCGGMCVKCYAVDGLEFHEPFGESNLGWAIFQSRVILCSVCHSAEHDGLFGRDRYIKISRLAEDVNIEMLVHKGYRQWIKDFSLNDSFARSIA